MATDRRVSWFEPYHASVRANASALREMGILQPWPWIRIVGLAFAITGAIIGWMRYSYPAMVVPWRGVIIAGPGFLLLAAVRFSLFVYVPRYVIIDEFGINVIRGQRSPTIPPNRVQELSLHDAGGELHMDVSFIDKRGVPQTVDVAVSPRVDLDLLASLLEGYSPRSAAAPCATNSPSDVGLTFAARSQPSTSPLAPLPAPRPPSPHAAASD